MQLFHNAHHRLLFDRCILTMNVVHQDGTKQQSQQPQQQRHHHHHHQQQQQHQIHSTVPPMPTTTTTTIRSAIENNGDVPPPMVTSTQTCASSGPVVVDNNNTGDVKIVLKNKKRTPKYRATKRPQSERRFQCDQCESRFFTQKDVKRHLVVHTGVRNFPCPFCEHRFGRKDHLVRHAKKSHGQDTRSLRRRNKNLSSNNGSATSNNNNATNTTTAISIDSSRKSSKRSARQSRQAEPIAEEADSSRNFVPEPSLSADYGTASVTIATSITPTTPATADPNELFFTRDSSTSTSTYETYNNSNLNMFSNSTSLISTTTSPKQVPPSTIVGNDNVAPNTFTSSSTSSYAASVVACRDHYNNNPANFDISYPPSYPNYLYNIDFSMNAADNSNVVTNNSYSVANLAGHHQQQQHQNHGFTPPPPPPPPPPTMASLCCLTSGSDSSSDLHHQQTQVSSSSHHHHHHQNQQHNNLPSFKLSPSTSSLYNFVGGGGGGGSCGIPIEYNNGTSTGAGMFQSSTSASSAGTSPVNDEVAKVVRHFHDHHHHSTAPSSSLFH